MKESLIMYSAAVLAIVIIIYMLIKKMDIKVSLFLTGIILIFISQALGKNIAVKDFVSTGSLLLDPLQVVVQQFKETFTSAGFVILILGGYTSYMSVIGANDVTVNILTKPISKFKSVYVLVPVVFLLGNVLSLVVPSASNLAIILLATLYPVIKSVGMSTLTAAAIITTSATIVPTPLGSDNVVMAQELAKQQLFAHLTVSDYVFKYHAIVSIPTLFFIAIIHFFWQKRMDIKSAGILSEINGSEIPLKNSVVLNGSKLYRSVYALLPIFPIVLLLAVYATQLTTGITITLSVEVAVLVSFILAVLCELIRHKGNKKVLESTETFFKGMGGAMSIVALLVAASVFVTGLKSIGLIEALQQLMEGVHGKGVDFVLPLILVAVTALVVLLSGSGLALFIAMVPLVVPLAEAADISPIAISVPMGLAANLFRAVSPVAAVVLIVAGSVKVDPIDIVKRTSIPMVSGVVFMFILSMIFFL